MSEQNDNVEKMGLMPASLGCRLRLLAANPSFDLKFLPKVIRLLTTSLFLQPIDYLESLRYRRAIEATTLDQEHIFILGHWRSGTTHLHNLMVQDPRFGFASTFQVVFPKAFFTLSHLRWFLDRLVPETRQFDNAEVSFDLPQEDEVALAYLSPYSIYHCFFYPTQLEDYCRKYVTLETINANEKQHLKKTYEYFLKKIAYASGNKPLIYKNPINTGRIPLLLELVPNAKFIFIHRNPYKATISEARALKHMVDQYTLENITYEDIERQVINNYAHMMRAYLNNRNLIPENHLVEVKFEDLMQDPMTQLETIYQGLQLDNFAQVKPTMEKYINDDKDYTHNRYQFNPESIATIAKKLDFVFDEWPCPALKD